MANERYQRGIDRMMELVSSEKSNTFDHVKFVESYKNLDADLSDYIISFAFGDIYTRTGLTKEKIVGALIYCIPYVGFPRVLNALTLLKEVMAERELASQAAAA